MLYYLHGRIQKYICFHMNLQSFIIILYFPIFGIQGLIFSEHRASHACLRVIFQIRHIQEQYLSLVLLYTSAVKGPFLALIPLSNRHRFEINLSVGWSNRCSKGWYDISKQRTANDLHQQSIGQTMVLLITKLAKPALFTICLRVQHIFILV